MRGIHDSPLRGTGTRDVPAIALDALAVLLFALSRTSASCFAVWAIKLVRETPVEINNLLFILYYFFSKTKLGFVL